MNWTATTVSTQNIARGRGLRPRFDDYEGPRNGDYVRYVDELMRWAERDQLLAAANAARAAVSSAATPAPVPKPVRQSAQSYAATTAAASSGTTAKSSSNRSTNSPNSTGPKQSAQEKQRERLERKLAQKQAAQNKPANSSQPEVHVAYRKSSQAPAYMPMSESMQQELPEDAEASGKSKMIFWTIVVVSVVGIVFAFPGLLPILFTVITMMVIGAFSKDKGKGENGTSLKTPK